MSSSNSATHELPRQLTIDVPEHQVVISFNDDSDADGFYEWWGIAGFEAFGEWIDEGRPS